MSRVQEVVLTRDAYMVCSQHVHTTDGEEVMGLLVGQYIPVQEPEKQQESKDSSKGPVTCLVSHAVILRRSDKRKDRVEISPEMLIQAQQKAEEISQSNGTSVHIVGWYHSHPKITVAPSAVDLRTQLGYQQMDDRFVGIIFSVFNRSETTKVNEEVVGGFQALQKGRDSYERLNVPVTMEARGGIARHNQEALCSLSNILQQEQLAVLQQSRELHAVDSPLQHLYNSAVAVQRVLELCEQIPGPMASMVHSRTQQTVQSVKEMDKHIHYLTKLVKDKSLLDEVKREEENHEEERTKEGSSTEIIAEEVKLKKEEQASPPVVVE